MILGRKIISGLLACSFTTASFAKPVDRITEVRYADLASIMLNLYSLTEAEAEHKRRTANHVNAAVQDANAEINQENEKNKSVTFKKLTEYELLAAAFKSMQFLRSYRSDELLLHSVLPTVQDLEFFDLHSGLFSKIDKTVTTPGKIVLASMVTNPLVSTEKMDTRKALISSLIQNEELFNSLSEVVSEFSTYQDALFSYYSNNAALNALIEKKVMKPFGFNLKNSFAINAYHRSVDTWPLQAFFIGLGLYRGLNAIMIIESTKYESKGHNNNYEQQVRVRTRYNKSTKFLPGVLAAAYSFLTADAERKELIRYIHNRTIALTSVIRSAGKLQDLISSDVSLAQGLKNSSTYSDLLNNSNISSKTFNKIRKELFESASFTGIGRYYYLNIGRVLSTDARVRQALNDFAGLFEMIGEVDAYLAIAKLVKDSQTSPNVFSLVDGVANETEPKLLIENFWHPALDAKIAVNNTMKFKDGFRGIILTGSNTGGKSTSLKAMLLTSLLGQGLGVAAAEKATFTPFAFIGSFMNITDDIREKASLFQAEVDRARQLIEIGKDVARHQKFGIVVMDELFTGTNPRKGAEGSERVANKLFINTNLITLFATHYDNMSSLEARFPNRQVLNYKIDVAMNDKGRYVHSYKLEQGISEVGIADYLYDRDL